MPGPFGSGFWNERILEFILRINWRVSLVLVVVVILVLIVYIKVVVVKKFVVGFLA